MAPASSTAALMAALLAFAVCLVCVVWEVGVGVGEKFNFNLVTR